MALADVQGKFVALPLALYANPIGAVIAIALELVTRLLPLPKAKRINRLAPFYPAPATFGTPYRGGFGIPTPTASDPGQFGAGIRESYDLWERYSKTWEVWENFSTYVETELKAGRPITRLPWIPGARRQTWRSSVLQAVSFPRSLEASGRYLVSPIWARSQAQQERLSRG